MWFLLEVLSICVCEPNVGATYAYAVSYYTNPIYQYGFTCRLLLLYHQLPQELYLYKFEMIIAKNKRPTDRPSYYYPAIWPIHDDRPPTTYARQSTDRPTAECTNLCVLTLPHATHATQNACLPACLAACWLAQQQQLHIHTSRPCKVQFTLVCRPTHRPTIHKQQRECW